jgi:hypothetical protein
VVSNLLPLLGVLIDDMGVGEVEVNGGGAEAVMAEDLLNGRQGDAFLERRCSECMPQHARRHILGDAGTLATRLTIFCAWRGPMNHSSWRAK